MAARSSDGIYLADGSFDWSGGVDSSKVTTVQSTLNPNGLRRNQLAWGNNLTVRGGSISQRAGWQPLLKLIDSGLYQGGFLYEPDGANPYLVCSISGHIYKALLEAPFTVTELLNTVVAPWTSFGVNTVNGALVLNQQFNPAHAERVYFCQGENLLFIQAGDFFTTTPPTLPLIWNGTVLRRSIGITNNAPPVAPNINEIPAATCMDYYGGRLWYAQNRTYSAGDIVGGPSGTAANHFRDAIQNVTENPLCFGGDGFTVPTNAGIIRALKHSANLNASLGEGQFFIFTRKAIYSLSVPTTRADWIAATNNNQPLQTVVQLVNGAVNDRSIVPVNGDLFYQSFDPSIRSLISAVRYFQQWGNTPISQNEERALDLNDRGLMRYSSGIQFNNRLLELVLPQASSDGVNIIHKAILPLDFDTVTSLNEQAPVPAWEGAWDALDFLEIYQGDFGGLPRAFGAVVNLDGTLNIWELTTSSRTENGDNRVTWSPEFPALTWAVHGLEFKLKNLRGGECWIDKISGTVEMAVYYREDADPCWRPWFQTSFCALRCEDEPATTTYPCAPYREGYKFPVVFPEPPKPLCDTMGVRPTTLGYQFQVKIMFKGWCRVRGLILYALPVERPQYEGIACPPETTTPQGMAKLPNPFDK